MEFDSILDQSSSINGDILQDATDLESNFFRQGYQEGYDHGRLHGLFEGRELGKEKAFEIWEELGFYEGWAGLFIENLKTTGKEGRALNHAKILIDLINQFPTTNNPEAAEIDLTALVSNIRARYRLLCASLGVKPRFTAAGTSSNASAGKGDGSGNGNVNGNMVEGVEGPIKGVDTSKLKF